MSSLDDLAANPPEPGTAPRRRPAREEQFIEVARPAILDHMPYRLPLKTIRSMTDEQLLLTLTGEAGERRPLDFACQHAVSAELLRRQMAESRKPHKITFWATIATLVVAVIAALAAVATVPQVQQLASPAPAPAQSSPTNLPPRPQK